MKAKVFTLLSGLMLLAAVSCQEPLKNINPNYDAEKNEVKAQFVFNVSTDAPATKQTLEPTQADGTFRRGIYDGCLITMEQTFNDPGNIMVKDATMSKYISLPEAVTVADLSSGTRRVYEMALPLKTNVALFYGKAPQGSLPEEYAGNFNTVNDYFGKLSKFKVGIESGSAEIELANRLSNSNAFSAVENVLSALMTTIMATNVSQKSGKHSAFSYGTFSFDGSIYTYDETADSKGYPGFYWSAYLSENNSGVKVSPLNGQPLSPLEEKLANVYSAMMSVRSGELRAGSGEAVLRTLTDLWTVVNEVRCATPTGPQEAMAKFFAKTIHDRLLTYLNATTQPEDGSAISGTSFKTVSDICTQLAADTFADAAADVKFWPENGLNKRPAANPTTWATAIGSSASLIDFPAMYSMPRGATHMKIYNQDHEAATQEHDEIPEIKEVFYYPSNFDTSAMGGDPIEGGAYNANSYYYPAELTYFANSPLRTNDSEVSKNNYPGNTGEGARPWNESSSWGGWEDGANGYVKSSTRAVALKYEVNYGCAMLKTWVGYTKSTDADKMILNDGSGDYIFDNNHAVQLLANPSLGPNDEPDNKIYIDESSFKLKGIIIGGQHVAVDWDFLPVGTETGFIYDKIIPSDAQSMQDADVAIANRKYAYTLVFDNFVADATTPKTNGIYNAATTQETVYVALELQNCTGSDFYGNANLIRKEGYFYLIGALVPSQASNTITWPTNHIIPPYTAVGGSQQITRVFIQDFVTTARFTIGQQSLRGAYLTVPDLRSSSLTLGLSVDTSWETGLNFDDVIMGY